MPSDTGLFEKKFNSGHELILYSPSENKIYGIIAIRKFNTSDFAVSYVAAEQGYGVYMYELAMMYLDDDGAGLMPDRTGNIRPKAWNIWKRFYDRDDVEKYPATGNNYSAKTYIFLGADETEKDVEIYNTIYYMQPDNDFFTLIKNAEEYVSKKEPDKVYDLADKFFRKKY